MHSLYGNQNVVVYAILMLSFAGFSLILQVINAILLYKVKKEFKQPKSATGMDEIELVEMSGSTHSSNHSIGAN